MAGDDSGGGDDADEARQPVVKSSAAGDEEAKFEGLEELDVGSKFRMFERGSDDLPVRPASSARASDRYGIMEKLKRLQEGEDMDDLLAEMDEEMPSATIASVQSDDDDEDEEDLTMVQRKTAKAERMWEDEKGRKKKLAEKRKAELKALREKLMSGTRDGVLDQLGDVLNASANKIKKTRVDVKSVNASRFRDMFDKGEVPVEGAAGSAAALGVISEKEQELEMMRKSKREQKEFFKKLERGEVEENQPKEPKLLARRIKDVSAI